ncbi:MAG TPA: sugar transferase [Longimicrobiales bacterium]|nr:sugar transferase [Longimicrobiales bacterium]
MGVAAKPRRPAKTRARLRKRAAPVAREPVRRAFDIAGALVLLVLLLPVLLLAAAAVALSGRPIFFGHERLGRNGTRFRCWKLRTMHPDAEHWLDEHPQLRAIYERNGFKIRGNEDPRITLIGRWLRRTYVDELPQLFNVLGGSMSLIGPRPIVDGELQQYGRHADDLLRVKPGVFGAWTSLGRRRPPYPQRARLELAYARSRRSIARDLRILLRSVPAVLTGQSE